MVCTTGAIMSIEKLEFIYKISKFGSYRYSTQTSDGAYVPTEDANPVSVQGRPYKHLNFQLNDLEVSSSVRNIILHGYSISFVALLWPHQSDDRFSQLLYNIHKASHNCYTCIT